MKLFKIFLAILFLSAGMALESNAQDFVYKPKNPAFGGDTFNHQWLMSSAQQQNPYKEESESSRFDLNDRNDLDNFSERLRSQLLNSISRGMYSNDLFGEGGLQEGMYELGDFVINVVPTDQGMMVEIFDSSTGGRTVIQVPSASQY